MDNRAIGSVFKPVTPAQSLYPGAVLLDIDRVFGPAFLNKCPSFTEFLLYEVCLTKVEHWKSSPFSSEETGIWPICLPQSLCHVKLSLGSQQLKEGSSGGPIWLARITTKMYGFWGWQWLHGWVLDWQWSYYHQHLSFWHQCKQSTQPWWCQWQHHGSFFRPFLLEAWLPAWFFSLYHSVAYKVVIE